MSQSVTFLSLCSLIQIYYFENGPNVTITSQIISRPNFIALFYFTLKLFTKMWFLTFIKCQHYVQLFWSCPYDKETVEKFQLFFFFFYLKPFTAHLFFVKSFNCEEFGSRWMSVELTCYVKTIVFWIIFWLLL